jgi:hypothetical protein
MRADITDPGPRWKRLAWFAGIWAASVAVLGVVAWIVRLVVVG